MRQWLFVLFVFIFASFGSFLPQAHATETPQLRPATEAECAKLAAQGLPCGLVSATDAKALGLQGFQNWLPNMYRYCSSRVCNKACRRNNPGNIRYVPGTRAATVWGGRANRKGDFSYFPTLAYGFAAEVDLLRLYCGKYRRCTIYSAIHRWAPAADNNRPTAYARRVSQLTRIPMHRVYDPNDADTMGKIAAAMACVENGGFPYAQAPLVQGLAMAMGKVRYSPPPNVGMDLPNEARQLPPVSAPDPVSPYADPGYAPPPPPSSPVGQTPPAFSQPDPDYQRTPLEAYKDDWQNRQTTSADEANPQTSDYVSDKWEDDGLWYQTATDTEDVFSDDSDGWSAEQVAGSDTADTVGTWQSDTDHFSSSVDDTDTNLFAQPTRVQTKTRAIGPGSASGFADLWRFIRRPAAGGTRTTPPAATQRATEPVLVGTEAQQFFQSHTDELPQSVPLSSVVTQGADTAMLQAPERRPAIPLPQWQQEVNLIDAEALRRWYQQRRQQASEYRRSDTADYQTLLSQAAMQPSGSSELPERRSFWETLWYWLSFSWLFGS